MSAPQQQQQPSQYKLGIVKQILSGDSVIIREAKGAPPREKTISFSGITAPKLARRLNEEKDEPYAWEAREFLRKKLIGEEVLFTSEKPPNANREYGCIYLGKDINTAENITEALVSEGLVAVRPDFRNSPETVRLLELEKAAQAAGKGKWSKTPSQDHVRNIKGTIENSKEFAEKHLGKPIPAIIEYVRDGSTVRAFLLPDFYQITLMISGIRCPTTKLDSEGKPDPTIKVPFAEEARYFVEVRLLQRDVEIVLDQVSNNKNIFIGSIRHPKGNIAEALVKEGFASLVEWTLKDIQMSEKKKLRDAEQAAKSQKLRIWQNYQPPTPSTPAKDREITGTVVEVVNGDALFVKQANGQVKKYFLSCIRPPKEPNRAPVGENEEKKPVPRAKNFRPLYDIPLMFEARECLRKRLIGKKVNLTIDYVQAAKDNFPEKTCCTVKVNNQNIAQVLVDKGLATVIKYKQDDDQRCADYSTLMDTEAKAIKYQKGVHAKKEIPPHRIIDISADLKKAKQFFPSLQREESLTAIVDFVASGSRMRLYIPKNDYLLTFLLEGINCPRGARPGMNGAPPTVGEPFGEEALMFTKEKILQREVTVAIDSQDKAGNFIGWLWIDNVNLSTALVKIGYASVHPSAERNTKYFTELKQAEDEAKTKKINIWKDFVEEVKEEIQEVEEDEKKVADKKASPPEKVIVTEITPELHFYAQHVDQGTKLESLMSKLRQEFTANPPLVGAYTPKRGDLCAAKFADDQWYRAKVEKVAGSEVSVFYVDYGNRETVSSTRCASLPSGFTSEKPFAVEYSLAYIALPSDTDYAEDAIKCFKEDALDRQLLLSVKYKVLSLPAATLTVPDTNYDIGQGLVGDGYVHLDKKLEQKPKKDMAKYIEAQESAKKNHLQIWQYGDSTEDRANEFGLGRP